MTYRTQQDPVSYDEAVRRVRALPPIYFLRASEIADLIWPGHKMKPQGAARAAGRFIRWMIRDKVIVDAGYGYETCRKPKVENPSLSGA